MSARLARLLIASVVLAGLSRPTRLSQPTPTRLSRPTRVICSTCAASPALFAQTPSGPPPSSKAPVDAYRVVRSYPHDSEAFTQGLEFADGFLYEGTGLNGRSSIRKVALDTGDVVQRRAVGAEHFGEGITIWNDRLFELTWQSQVALVYDRRTFQPLRTFSYTGEGWGLTHDATSLIMSDGTAALRFLDPATFRERRRVTVADAGVPVPYLNELEFVKGEIWANVWTTDFIVRIDPATGRVTGWIDLRGLLPARERAGDAVLNGIAYDAANDRVFVTGKLWPRLFEIKLVRR
jgi:glutamine cyclotransferase